MTPQVNLLFSSPVVKVKYLKSFDEEFSYIKNLIYEESRNRDNQITLEKYILNKSELSNIKDYINNSIQNYITNIYNSLDQLRITQSWVNKNLIGKSHHLHNHPNSILSGVFYFQCENSHINFHNTIQKTFQLRVSQLNNFNCPISQISVSSGDLLLFPSDLLHSVPPNTSSKERISLSFNTFVNGNLGHENLLNEVIF